MEEKNKFNLLEMPVETTRYFDVPEKDGALLALYKFKILSMNDLFKTYLNNFDKPDNDLWKSLINEYTNILSNYISTIYYFLSSYLEDNFVAILDRENYEVGYDILKEKIYIYKYCPKRIR